MERLLLLFAVGGLGLVSLVAVTLRPVTATTLIRRTEILDTSGRFALVDYGDQRRHKWTGRGRVRGDLR